MECRNCGYKLKKKQSVCPRCGYSFDYKKYEKEKRAGLAAASVGAVGLSAGILNKIKNIGNKTDAGFTVNASEIDNTNPISNKSVADNNFLDALSLDDSFTKSAVGENGSFSGEYGFGKPLTRVETADIDINDKISEILGLYDINLDKPLTFTDATFEINSQSENKTIPDENTSSTVNSTGTTNTTSKSVTTDNSTVNNLSSEDTSVTNTNVQGNSENTKGASVTSASVQSNTEGIKTIANDSINIDENGYYFNEEQIKATLSDYGLKENEISQVIEAARTGGEDSANKALTEIYSKRIEEYQNRLVDQMNNNSISKEDIINSLNNQDTNASQVSDSIDINTFDEEKMKTALTDSGLTPDEAGKVIEAYKTGEQDKITEAYNDINASRSQAAEQEMRNTLTENGLTPDEADKVIEAYKTGDQTAVENAYNEINESRYAQNEQSMRENLAANGFSDEEINRIIEAGKAGGDESVNQVLSEINAERTKQYENNLVDQLKQGGLSDEEISKVMEAYKTGDQTAVDNAYNEINAAKTQEAEKTMRDSLAASGMSEEDIERVMEAARTGGPDAANHTLEQINAERAKAYEEQLVKQLKESGITDEEISQVLDAYKTGDQDKVTEVLNEISEKHFEESLNEMRKSLFESGLTEEEVNSVIAAAREGGDTGANQALAAISEARAKAQEDQIAAQLRASGVDEDTILKFIKAYRNGDQNTIDKIYAQINAKKEWELRNQLSENFDPDTVDKLVAAYMSGDQKTIDAIYAELAAKREEEFIQNLIDKGITNEQDLKEAREAYRSGNQETLNKKLDEITSSYIKFDQKGSNDVALPKAYRIEAILALFGSCDDKVKMGNGVTITVTNRFTSNSKMSDIRSGNVTHESFQDVFSSIIDEASSGNFSKYDTTGTNQFGSFSLGGANFSTNISNYYDFLSTLKGDLMSLRNTLIRVEGEQFYYLQLEFDMAFDSMNSAGEANVDFYQQMGNLGIINYDAGVSASENEDIINFNNQIYERLSEYYDDEAGSEEMLAKLNPLNQPFSDKEMDKARARYEATASQIIIMINRAATKGLVDLQYEYENGATFADFTEAQFNEQCRDADGNIIFDYPNYNPNSNDPMAKLSQANRDMATFLFQQELLTSMDNASNNRSDTELYREFVDGAVNYSDDLNRKPNGEIDIEGYKLDPDCFAYSVISLAVQKEAFCPYTGQWRPGEVSNEYYNLARSYNPNTDGPYPEYLKNSGMATPRTALGNRVVDTFANIVNNKTSGQRLDCEYLNGSTLEEAFWLSYHFNEVTNPAYNSAVNDLASFQNTVSANGPFEALNLTEQEDYEVLIERLKNNPEYAKMFDKDGNLLSDYANINNLTNEEQKLMYQKIMTNAILATRVEIAEEANNNLLYQSQLFNLLIEQVDPTIVEKQIPVPSEEIKPRRPNEKYVLLDDKYETITETHYYRDANQQSGYDLYMKFVSDGSGSEDRSSIGDYLPNMIISAEEFSSNPELVAQYKDYKSYTYAFPTISGKYYDEVTNYLSNKKPPLNADENYNWLDTYNKFNDYVIDVSFNSSQFHLQCSQFTENMLGQLTSEAGTNKAKETFMYIGNSLAASQAGANATNAMSVGLTSMANSQSTFQKAYMNEASQNAERARTFSDLKHNFANMQIDVTAAIGNMNYEAVNFASKYSDFYDLAEEFRNYYKDCELKLDYTKDENGNAITTYIWVNGNGRVEVSKEQQALMLILAEKDGQHINWNLVDESVSKYAKNIKFLDKDENTNFDGVLNYLMFSRQKNINNDAAFAQQILNFSNLGFDTEARRRADEYTSDFFAKNISKLLNIKIEDNTDLIRQFGLTGLILASSEWLTEDVLLPVLHGVDGFIKSIGYAIGDTVMSATGNAHKIDFEPSLNDQTWAYVIDNYKQSGGFQMVNYYVTQAMTSLGNQAIPIALSYFSGGLSMGALFVSAYGNTLHSTLGEFVQYGHYNDQDEFEWATGRRPINAIIYALMDGAAEMVMEKVVGRMPGLSDSVSIGLKGFAKDIIGEMVEESLQEFLGPIFKDIATGDIRRSIANGTFDEQFFKFWGNEFDIEAIRDAAIIAAISSGVMNGAKNGKMIVKSLIDTNGQSSSLYQLLNLQENAMKAAGFTQEQIDQQIKANKNAALNNSANLKSLTQEILNSSSIESEYNSWKDGLGKNDPRGEMNLEEYASMRAIQSLSFDTTELQMQANLNTIRINQLESLLISDNQTKLRSELSELNAALEANPGDSTITDRINEIQSLLGDSKSGLAATLSELSTLIKANPNDMSIKEKLSQLQQYLSTSDHSYLNEEIETLRNQNTEINEQIAQVQTDAKLTIDANTQTITELNTKLTELQELQKTATGEELTSINEQITTVEEQINQLTRQNEIIEFNMADNARVLESKLENNENTLSEINEIINDEVLTDQDIDTLKNEIETLNQENLELNEKLEPALHEYAESLVVEETKTLNAIAALQQINKTDLENMTPKQREIYTQVQDVLNNMNERLDIIRGELNRLEAKGVTVEVRPTLESIIKANEETLKQFENIADLEVTEFLKTRTDIGLPEGVLDKLLEGVTTNKDVNVQPNLEPGLDTNVTETVAQTPITTFTQNMTLVISPLIMNIGFNIGDLINQNGEIMHNFGPSCGRIMDLLQTQTNGLTNQLESTPETDLDVRADLEQRINMNNNALGNLTALMAEFGIDENSPLTALMEKMKFDKMQLEEMRHKNEMNELQKPNIPYMDMMQEVMWSLREVTNSNLSNMDKYNSFASQISAISQQTGWTWQSLRDQRVQIDSIDGININNSQTTIGSILDYYYFMNESNFNNLLNDSGYSYTSRWNGILDFLNSELDLNSDQLFEKEFNNLSVDGRSIPGGLNLNDILSFLEGKQKALEYDVLRKTDGSFDRSCPIEQLKGLSTVETASLIRINDILNIIKNNNLSEKDLNTTVKSIVQSFSGIEYILEKGNIKQKLLSDPNSLTNDEIIRLASGAVGALKYKMLKSGVGLLKTTQTSDGKIVKVFGQNEEIAEQMINRFEEYYESLPRLAKQAFDQVSLYSDFKNPFDDFWAINYNKGINNNFTSAATGGGGIIDFWNINKCPSHMNFETLCHESGHNIDSMIAKVLFNEQSGLKWTDMPNNEWQKAKDADERKVSTYGEKAIAEDFAEAYRRYLNDNVAFKQECPNRARLIEDMLIKLDEKIFGQTSILDIMGSEITTELDNVVKTVQNLSDGSEVTAELDNVVKTVQNLSDGSEVTAELDNVVKTVQNLSDGSEVTAELDNVVKAVQNVAVGEQKNSVQTTVEIDLGQDTLKTDGPETTDQTINIEGITTDIIDKMVECSDQNKNTLKQRILDKVESDMTQLEKIKLLYHELGSKVDYSEQFRYALNNKDNPDAMKLYEALYSKKMTMESLETERSIICVNWTQLYSEMLMAAGIDSKSIVVQRVVDENGEIVLGTHAGMAIVLDDGSVVLPDLTGRLIKNKIVDVFNVKVGNETSGFIYFTSEQVKQLSQLIPNELSYGIKNMTPDGAPSSLDPTIESFLNYASSLLFSNEFRSEEEANRVGLFDGKSFKFDPEVNAKVLEYVSKEKATVKAALQKLGYKADGYMTLKDARLTMESDFFKSILTNNENKQIIAKVDTRIKQIFKSDFFLKEMSQDLLKYQKENDSGMISNNKIDEQFLGLQNINSKNMLDIYNYFKQTAGKEKLFRGDNRIDGDHISLVSISENRTEIRFTVINDGSVLTNYRVFMNADGKIDVGKIVPLNSDFTIMDVVSSKYRDNTLFAINGNEYSLFEVVSMINEKSVAELSAAELDSLLENKNLLKSYCDLLQGDNLKSFIQQLTFSDKVFDALEGVIKLKTIASNIKASQIDSLCTCINNLKGFRKEIFISELLYFQSDDVFIEAINHFKELKIDFMYAMNAIISRGMDGNLFFSKINIDDFNCFITANYGTADGSNRIINTVTDENIINKLKFDDRNIFRFERSDGGVIYFKYIDTLNIRGKTLYHYSIGNGNTILSENNILEMFLKGNTTIKELIINEVLSANNIEMSKSNNGVVPLYEINYENGTCSIKNSDTATFVADYFDKVSDIYDWFIEQSRHDKNNQFGSNQRVSEIDEYHDILKQKKNGKYVLADSKYKTIYNNLVNFLSQKYNASQDMINTIIMETIDRNRGACTYADLANKIFMKFANNPEGFKNTFGFDMYEIIDGKKAFNYRLLIADMYIQMNSVGLSTHPIFKLIDGKLCFETVTNEDGSTRLADSREQVYMDHENVIDGYMQIHSLDGEFKRNIQYDYIREHVLDIDKLKNDILLGMSQGKIYSLVERAISIETDENGIKTNKIVSDEIVMHCLDDNSNTSTYSWDEGGGHITTIVGVRDDGFIVASWGRRYLIKFSDLNENNYGFNYEIDMLDIKNIDNKITEIVDSREELERTLELDEVVNKVQETTLELDEVVNKVQQTISNIMSLINENNISALTQEQIDFIFNDEELLSKACSILSGESIVRILSNSTSENAFMNLLNAMGNFEVDENGESAQLSGLRNALKNYFASPDARVSELIQQLTFSTTIFDLLSGTISTKALISNVNANQVESIFNCINSLYGKKRIAIIKTLLESQSEDVFKETLKYTGDPFNTANELSNAYSMLSGETIFKMFTYSTSENAFMNLLNVISSIDTSNNDELVKLDALKANLKSYFESLSSEQLSNYIQQLTFSKGVLDALTGVIGIRTLMNNIKASQIESISSCISELSHIKQDIIIRELLESKSDEVFYTTLDNVSKLNIWPAAAMDRALKRGIDANVFFSREIGIVQQMIAWHYNSDERAKAVIDSITDENAIYNLINNNIEISLERNDGKSIGLRIKETLNIGGRTIYAYSIGKDIIFSENNLIEIFLRGDAGIKDFVVNYILSAKNIELYKQNNGMIPTYDFNYKERTYAIRTNNTMKLLSNVYTQFLEQFRYGDKYTQFGANQRIRQIDRYHNLLKQTKSGNYVLSDLRYKKIYNNLVSFLSQKYGMSQDMVNTVIMETIDVHNGVCSYSSLANMIFMKFANNPEGFKNSFGFDMYETFNGRKVLNYRLLIADMFVEMNTERFNPDVSTPVFKYIDGKICFNTITDENGNTRIADSREESYMSDSENVEIYLQMHGLSGMFTNNYHYKFIEDQNVNIDSLKNDILFGMAQGKVYSLIERARAIETDENGTKTTKIVSDELILYSLDNDSKTSTYNWNEGGGHITTIVGVTDEGFIVASWGRKYLVKFSDLKVNEYGPNFGIAMLDVKNASNMISDQTMFESLTESNVKANRVISLLNEVISQIKFDFVNSITSIPYELDTINQQLIRNFRNLSDDIKYQIKDSMTAIKNYLKSVPGGIKEGIKTSYESVVKGINSILELFNKSEVEIVSEANSMDLKETIMSEIDSSWDGISQARKAYLELNKAVNYDPNYSYALEKKDLDTKAAIYNIDTSFSTLEGRNVICKGWSQLYRELLIEIGFNPNDIVIMGGDAIGSHKWVRLDLHNGYVLLADAADAIQGTNDLANSKIGSKTNGFLIVPYEYANERPSKIDLKVVLDNFMQMKNIDDYIGYTKNGMYFDEIYRQYQQKYSKKIFSDRVLRNSLFKMEFTKEMDGTDAYVLMKKICKLINQSLDSNSIMPKPTIYFRNTENGLESVASLMVDDSNGKTKFLLYSKSLGKIIVTEGTLVDLEKTYGLIS